MNYEIVVLEQKTVVGITGRTGNTDPACQQIIGGLWQRFMADGMGENVPHRNNTYCIGLYSNYDEASYDVTIGVEVAHVGSTVQEVPAGKYACFHVTGDVVSDVAAAWNTIWSLPLERSFTGDFEEYISNIDGVAEIDIYVALK